MDSKKHVTGPDRYMGRGLESAGKKSDALWLQSIYSDGTEGFVSNPSPSMGDTVQVSIRLFADAPVRKVFVRYMQNGAEQYVEAKAGRTEGRLVYYEAPLQIREPRVSYHFVLVTKEKLFYYTQAGVQSFIPGYGTDFCILGKDPTPDWVKGAVFYQIFPSAFGGLRGILEHIPYLQELGITVLYVNPVFSAPSAHKYDCADYLHVDPAFGGDEALAQLTDALHKAGIRIILDISINHTGITHTWIRENKPYYFQKEDGSYVGWAGYSHLPVLDYRNPEVRQLIYEGEDAVLRKWLRPPYNIDGWRFDVADVFGRMDDVQLADELWQGVCKAVREENPKALIIGEHWGDCTPYLREDLWNGAMNYAGFGRQIRQFAGLQDLFLMRNPAFAGLDAGLSAADVEARTEEIYRYIPQRMAESQMNLFDSHDVPRLHNHPQIGYKQVKLAVCAQLLWTGIPCIYYGDEKGIDGYTHHDSGFRYPMPWEKEDAQAQHYTALYKTMIRLRRSIPAFAQGGRKVLLAEGKILAIARFHEDSLYLGILSMEDKEQEITICPGLFGASRPAESMDAFGTPIFWREEAMPGTGEEVLTFRVAPGESYIIAME